MQEKCHFGMNVIDLCHLTDLQGASDQVPFHPFRGLVYFL